MWQELLENSWNIIRRDIAHLLHLRLELNGHTWAHIRGVVDEVDLQAFVAEDGLLFAEERHGIFWQEGVQSLVAAIGGGDMGDVDRIECPRLPYDR